MYKNFFGLVKDPFNVSPDPYFLFSTAETDKAYASLLYGIRARKGLMLLAGEVGTGKTLLLRKLLEQLQDEATATAFVFNPRMSVAEFLDYAVSDFGIEHDSSDRLRTLKTLQEWLLERYRKGQASVLIIDEAQNLSTEVFEVVRVLSNLETPTEKLLQIILSGQREIEEKLRQPELRPFTQRIALRLHTIPLSPAETSQYIAHRLRVAGGHVEKTFTPEAIKAVYQSSAGIPRLINLICEHALISGFAEQQKPVGAGTVREVAQGFGLGAAALGEEALADKVSRPLETGVLTQQKVPKVISQPNKGQVSERVAAQPFPAIQPAEAPKSWGPQLPSAAPAPPAMPSLTMTPPGASHPAGEFAGAQSAGGNGPRESPAGRPVIAAKSPAGAQGSAEGTSVAPREAQQPLLPKAAKSPVGVQVSAGSTTFAPREAQQPLLPKAAKSPAGAQGSAGGTNVAPREAQQPLLLKKGAARPGFAHISNLPPKRARERPSTLKWMILILALILMVVILEGYYLIGSGLLMKTRRVEPPPSRSQSLTSGKSPTGNLAGPRTPSPSGRTGVARQEQAPTQPATSVPGGKAGQVTAIPAKSAKEEPPSESPRPLSRFTSESSETPSARKQATLGTSVPLRPPAPGQLTVTSNVPGATIAVDGRSDPNWTTPHMFTDLSPGAHRIVVSKQGYNEAQQGVTVGAGRETSVNATLTPPRGEIDISTRPPGAEVLIDGKSYGPGPVRAEVDAGQHTFLVRQAGREPVEGNLVVQDQAVVQRTIDLPLKPLPPPVMNVAVTTNPPSATVDVDGAPMGGQTPTSFHLSPGRHTLIISAAGYRPVQIEIDVPKDGTVTVSSTLSGQ